MNSILDSIKKLLMIHDKDPHFDEDLIIHINAAFDSLHQVGVGPSEGFHINGNEEEWSDYLPDPNKQNMAKSYVYLKVKSMFDPPNASLLDAIEKQLSEFAWRLMVDDSTY